MNDRGTKGETDMEDKAMQVVQGVKPNVVNWIGALIGAALAWWTACGRWRRRCSSCRARTS